jgi:hypothetical protein
MDMIEGGHGTAESPGTKKLLGIKSAVGFTKLNVMLVGEFA